MTEYHHAHDEECDCEKDRIAELEQALAHERQQVATLRQQVRASSASAPAGASRRRSKRSDGHIPRAVGEAR